MSSRVNLEKYHFYNFPKRLYKSDYQKVCNLVVDRLRDNPNIASIYLYLGNKNRWVPGISDLDISIVYKKSIDLSIGIPVPFSLSGKARAIFTHGYLTHDIDSFENLFYIFPDKLTAKLLYGREIEVRFPKKELSALDYQFLQGGLIFDLLLNKLLFFPSYLQYKNIDVRNILLEFHSLVYTLEMLKILDNKGIDSTFPEKIKALRNNWFDLDKNKRLEDLISLLYEGVDIVLESMNVLNNFISLYVDSKKEIEAYKDVSFRNYKYHITFIQSWSKKLFLDKYKKGYIRIKNPFSGKNVENFRLVLPLNLLWFFLKWCSGNGPLSSWIRNCMGNISPQAIYSNIGIERHIDATNKFVKTSVNNDYLFKIPFSFCFPTGRKTFFNIGGRIIMRILRLVKK